MSIFGKHGEKGGPTSIFDRPVFGEAIPSSADQLMSAHLQQLAEQKGAARRRWESDQHKDRVAMDSVAEMRELNRNIERLCNMLETLTLSAVPQAREQAKGDE